MSIEEQVMYKYPVLFDESQCAALKRTRDGLRDAYRQRLLNTTYDTKEGGTVMAPINRDWFGRPIETKTVISGTSNE